MLACPRPGSHWPAPARFQKYSRIWERWLPRRSFFVNGKQYQGPAAAHGSIGAFFSVFCSATNNCVVHIGVHRYRRLLR